MPLPDSVARHLPRWLSHWSQWEYWPLWLSAAPIVGIYLWFALRARHLFFFSNVNPSIPLGGAMGESKRDIMALLPPHVCPLTIWAPAGLPFGEVLRRMDEVGLSFPVVAKPDVGERGFLVKRVEDADTLRQHLARHYADFLVQEFVDDPIEAAVLFCRFPDGRFSLLSVCLKTFLAVEGDGSATVRELLALNPRAAFQRERLEREQPQLLAYRPAVGERVVVEPIGNHARGTQFVDACYLISPAMTRAFEALCQHIPGVCFGRFDLKCPSVEALERAEGKILELNGVLADPAHVFDPACGARVAYRTYYHQWHTVYKLHLAQRKAGIRPTPHGEGFKHFFRYLRYKKRASNPP